MIKASSINADSIYWFSQSNNSNLLISNKKKNFPR